MNIEKIINTNEEAINSLLTVKNFNFIFNSIRKRAENEGFTNEKLFLYEDYFYRYIYDIENKGYETSIKNFTLLKPMSENELLSTYLASYYAKNHFFIKSKVLKKVQKKTLKEVLESELPVNDNGETEMNLIAKDYEDTITEVLLNEAKTKYNELAGLPVPKKEVKENNISTLLDGLTFPVWTEILKDFYKYLNEVDINILRNYLNGLSHKESAEELGLQRDFLYKHLEAITFRLGCFMYIGKFNKGIGPKIKVDETKFNRFFTSDRFSKEREKYTGEGNYNFNKELLINIIKGKKKTTRNSYKPKYANSEPLNKYSQEELEKRVNEFDPKAKMVNKNANGINQPMWKSKVDIHGVRHNNFKSVINCYGWVWDFIEKKSINL